MVFSRVLPTMPKIPNKKITKKGIDPMVYLSAVDFHNTANEVSALRRTNVEIVNYTFAIELYFKSILSTTVITVIETPEYPKLKRKMSTFRGHKLYNDLFIKLTNNDQEALTKLYDQNHSRDLTLDLKEINSDFETYRYSHEHNDLSTTLVHKDIADTIKVFIETEMKKNNYSR